MGLRDKILSGSKLKIEAVEAFDTIVYVQELTGKERDAFEASLSSIKGKNITMTMDNVRAKLVIRSLCDEDGLRVFEDADLESVGNLPASELDKVFEVAQRISGLKKEDIEELTKNS